MADRLAQYAVKTLGLMLLLCLAVGITSGKHKKAEEPPFQYVAGTEDIERGCAGKLQVLKSGFAFECPLGNFQLPFATITLMQYRPDLSADLQGMKIPWKVKPQIQRLRENKYFAIVSQDAGNIRAVVFRVDEDEMRPYFAEIELQSGKSVQEYRSFGEFD